MNKNLKLKTCPLRRQRIKNLISQKKYIPNFIISFYHWSLAYLAAVVYGFPSRRMVIIGVTGTNGKSTTVLMIARILEQAGFKVGSVSSIWYKINRSEKPNPLHMTMPGRFRLQKLLRQMIEAGCQYAVLEVTSEGIRQHRHRGINFDIAVLTNLTPEHIEAHGSFEKYREAKAKLFAGLVLGLRKRLSVGTGPVHSELFMASCPVPTKQVAKVAVVNLDDKSTDYFLKFKTDISYGFSVIARSDPGPDQGERRSNPEVIVTAKDIQRINRGYSFGIQNTEFRISLIGQFNINNALAAICVGLSQNISLEKIKTALAKIKTVPGRMEIVQHKPFTVIIDLAHTPPAVKQVYLTARRLLDPRVPPTRKASAGQSEPEDDSRVNARLYEHRACTRRDRVSEDDSRRSKVITVFGSAGGGRDKWKRPRLGELAAKYCDKIILTNEDPYDEEPEKIIDDIVSGIPVRRRNEAAPRSCNKNVFKIPDRRQAICQALNLARPKDIVLILGKGTEPTMVFAHGKKIPWDDRQVAREELEKLDKKFENSSIENYEVLDHPADLKIKAFGKTRQEVFLNMLRATADYQLEQLPDNTKKQSGIQRKIQIKSPDLKQLLVDFLSEVLYLTEVNSEIYTDIKFEKFNVGTGHAPFLQGQLAGFKISNFSSPIKAVTYHDLSFERVGDHWQAVVLFDI